jgi:WXG100 family type VII secretion target
MAKDIDVDLDELEKFIDVLRQFQDTTSDKLTAVKSAWATCDESWEGSAKEKFTQEYTGTEEAVTRALEAGDDAIRWLEKFHEIVQEMEDS